MEEEVKTRREDIPNSQICVPYQPLTTVNLQKGIQPTWAKIEKTPLSLFQSWD